MPARSELWLLAMQFLSRVTANVPPAHKERAVAAHVPYVRHIDDNTLMLRGDMLIQCVKLDGLLFETADSDELNYRASLRAALLRAIGSSRLAVYHHLIRREVALDRDGPFADGFAKLVDDRWNARMQSRKLYSNELFLTIVRRPPPGRGGLMERLADKLGLGGGGIGEAQMRAELRQLDSARDALMAALSPYSPRLLSVYDDGGGVKSEPLEFLGYLLNGAMQPVAVPVGPVADYLPRRRISFGRDALELAAEGELPREFQAIISIKDYPADSLPGMFDDLYRLPVQINVSQSFAFVERRESVSRMNLAIRRMRSTEDEAISLRNELVQAKDAVAAGRTLFGEHHMTIAVRADTLHKLDNDVAEISALLADLGIVAVRENIGLEPSFWAQLPGNFPYIARRALISADNFAGFASLHNFPSGRAQGNHWGDAVTLFETTSAGPYFFNFHNTDLGNFTIIGPSGSGKTVVLNFLLAQALRYDPKVIFFDKDRGAELFIRALGGQYDRVAPDSPVALNPLLLPNTPVNLQFLMDWIGLLADGLTSEEQALVRQALAINFDQPPMRRRLRHFVTLLRGHAKPSADDLFARLQPWWGDGELAWLFDNAEDGTDLNQKIIGFDITSILDDPVARTPALLYFFHRVEERLDGQPTIIVIDEGWKALDDDIFVRRIKDWEKTIRKRNGIIGFATQSAQDALESKIAGAIIEQAATQIFMVNPRAQHDEYVGGFGLTDHEFALVRSLPDRAHCFLVKHGNDSVVVRLDLSGERDILTILSGREETVRKLDAMRSATGQLPDNWAERIMGAR
jgi:type IV secretion system protein VirB4